jgi:DNA-binding PadR family transcriptional regulator
LIPRSKLRGRRNGSPGDVTTADLVVLSLLLERPMHGYDLLDEYRRQEVADWASISKAQMYYALKKLHARGLLRGDHEAGASGERTVYRPTAAGRKVLATELADPRWAEGRIAQPFATWFGLSMHAPPYAQKALLEARVTYLEREIEKEQESLKFLLTLTDPRAIKGTGIVRLTIAQLGVEVAWLRDLLGVST